MERNFISENDVDSLFLAEGEQDESLLKLFNHSSAALHFRYYCPTASHDAEFRLSVERCWQELLNYYAEVPFWVVVQHGVRAQLYPFSHSPLSKVFEFASANIPVYQHGNWLSGAYAKDAHKIKPSSYISLMYSEQFVVTLSVFFECGGDASQSMIVLANVLENAAIKGVTLLSLEESGDVSCFSVDVEQLISIGENGGTNLRPHTPPRKPFGVVSFAELKEKVGFDDLDELHDLHDGYLSHGCSFVYGNITYEKHHGVVCENEPEDYLYSIGNSGFRFVTCLMNASETSLPEICETPSLLCHVANESNWPCWHVRHNLINGQDHYVLSRLIFLPDMKALSDCVLAWRHYPSMSFFSDVAGTELTGIMRAKPYGNVLYYHALSLSHQLTVEGYDYLELTCRLSSGNLYGNSYADFGGGFCKNLEHEMIELQPYSGKSFSSVDCLGNYSHDAVHVISFSSDREVGRFMQLINEIDHRDKGVVCLADIDMSCLEVKCC